MAYATYTAVTPSGTENPMLMKWYVKVGTVYHRTTDTTVQVGTTYYSKGGGYLVKVGTYTVPLKYIKADTYQCVWSVVDFDSYRDAEGELHRDAVSARRIMKVEWETPDMSDEDLATLLTAIQNQYSSATAKSATVTAWMPEEMAYKTDKCYLTSDVNFTIRYADAAGLRYDPVRFAFIGYGTSSAT